MAAKKIRDLAVKTGEFTNNQGETKGRYQNVGSLMKSEDGGEFVILNRWFNPAGIPNPDDRDSVIVSCFKPRQEGQAPQPAPAPQAAPPADYDNDMPF